MIQPRSLQARCVFDGFAAPSIAARSGPLAILGLLVAAAGFGALLAFVYRLTSTRTYKQEIAESQIVLATLMALVMMIVGDNLSRAFGAVGILSVMRLRVRMRGPSEALNLLGAVVVGMATGVGLLREALIGACFLSLLDIALAYVFHPSRPGRSNGQQED